METQDKKIESQPKENHIIRDAVFLLGGFSGLTVALLWLTGRNYMGAYFRTMNIPRFLISYSIWEYGESSWLFLLFPIILFINIIYLYLTLKERGIIKHKAPFFRYKHQTTAGKIEIAMFTIIILIVYIIVSVSLAQFRGRSDAYNSIKSLINEEVTLVSKSPLYFEAANNSLDLSRNDSPPPYLYTGFRLLTYNNGKYYLYKELDKTCKPIHVFIIDDEDLVQVNLVQSSPLLSECSKISVGLIATPTQSATETIETPK